MNTPGTTEIKSGLDPLDTQAGLQQPSSVANPEAVFSSSGPVIDHGDRDAFGLRLQQQYHHYAVNDIPFLLIALGGDRTIIPNENNATVAELGLTSKEVHEAHQIRDAANGGS